MRNALRKEVSLEGVNPHVQVQVPPSGQGHWQVPGIHVAALEWGS